MTNKKAPLAWRRRGQNEASCRLSVLVHSAETAREPQEQSCPDCSFYRVVPLDSGRVRALCMFLGTKNPVAPCHGFQPGDWATTWADPDAPRQSLVCGLCGNAVASTRRGMALGATVCRLHRPEAHRVAPVLCPGFRTREHAEAELARDRARGWGWA